MEEDIEQIKSSLEELETERDDIQLKCIKAELELSIENLLTRYKQLEEENRIYGLEGCRVRLKMYIDKNYLPKSLVKEKIEELKEIADEDNKDEYIKIQVLQELLGEE